ncbi:MAG: ubiquinol-cytochrome c reductase iron-sulfur subunit [Desulfuromonadales bacterium]|jgi:cytochrome b6-f complex iron-sulfur subunit|nr:ubiquinol-cytochrome c reductase iron-sulfur subunit [Desulfuromonadales bacterium]
MSQATGKGKERRTFLGVLLGGFSVALGAAFGWPVFKFLAPRAGAGEAQQVKVPRDQVTIGGAHFFSYQGRPAVMLQPEAGHFVALSAVCTHLGCIVKWENEKGEFLCPCHGGQFSASGQVLGGPPPKPLDTYPVAVVDQDIIVG